MSNSKIGVSIVLPTLNEKENLEILIPELINIVKKNDLKDYEIIVVDDNSTDGTSLYIESLQSKNIKIIVRKDEKSLPKSIYEGILSSTQSHVMWLDADGSMDAESVNKLINKQIEHPEKVFVGSRFIENGGYKGQEKEENSNFFQYLKKISNSEDSLLAIILSKYFNKIIGSLLNIGISDLTSGFIIGKKEYFLDDVFSDSVYGEYFIYLMKNLIENEVSVNEIGYYCKPRNAGFSKTSTNYLILIKLSLPYIKAAIITNLRRN
tara:strand:+ start:21 stop:815 length:795 start_codon:yes stop_codon:yes gene_type:complete